MDQPSLNTPEFSVSELAQALKRTVEDSYGHVRVRGEISGFKRAASGHVYLSLKDDNAVIDGVMWSMQIRDDRLAQSFIESALARILGDAVSTPSAATATP